MKLQKLLLFATLFLSFSFISAQITLSPSQLAIASYPGETHLANITITTDGNYTVYLTSKSSGNITLNYTSPLIVEKTRIVQVAFIFPKDLLPGVYDINLTGSIDAYVDTPIIVNEVRGGGGIVYRNVTKVTYVKDPKQQETIDELNKVVENLTRTIVENNGYDAPSKRFGDFYLQIIGGAIVILALGFLWKYLKNRGNEKKEDIEENVN